MSLLIVFNQMTGSIYYPALNLIAADLHTTSTKINITVTTYLVSCVLRHCRPSVPSGLTNVLDRLSKAWLR